MSDNQEVVDIVNKISSKDTTLIKQFRLLSVLCCLKNNILFRAKHISRKLNPSADKLHRYQYTDK